MVTLTPLSFTNQLDFPPQKHSYLASRHSRTTSHTSPPPAISLPRISSKWWPPSRPLSPRTWIQKQATSLSSKPTPTALLLARPSRRAFQTSAGNTRDTCSWNPIWRTYSSSFCSISTATTMMSSGWNGLRFRHPWDGQLFGLRNSSILGGGSLLVIMRRGRESLCTLANQRLPHCQPMEVLQTLAKWKHRFSKENDLFLCSKSSSQWELNDANNTKTFSLYSIRSW